MFKIVSNVVHQWKLTMVVAALIWGERSNAFPSPLSTAFTYQGEIKQNGGLLNGTADFIFYLWDAQTGGTQVAGPVSLTAVSVSAGRFTVQVDFGSSIFNGEGRWLETAVRSPAGSGTYTLLFPRQPLTAAPYALQTRGLFVDSAGKVGIDTTAPSAKLHIANGDFVAGAPGQEWYFHPRSHMSGDFLQITDNDAGVPQFQRGLVIHQNGRVGIGTTAPGKSLTVAGSMEIGTSTGDYQHLRIGGGNSSGFLYGSFPALADGIHLGYNIYYDAAGTPHIINPGGGTSRITAGYGFVQLAAETFLGAAPVPLLNVEPFNCHFTGSLGVGTLPGGFMLNVAGSAAKPGGGSWTNSSDARLKRNIEPLQGALDQLLSLHGVTFEYIDPNAINELPGQRIGMIAQDVEKVFPDWVGERNDGFKTLTYRGFEALTVEALREMRDEHQTQLAVRDALIANMQDANEQLQSRLTALEAAIDRLNIKPR